ncbi:MAG: phosphatidylglycerophosphatase A, partial [Neomegalonema sp.]
MIATCGGVGFLPLAPGTWGSLLGLVIGFGLLALDEDGWLFLVCLMMLSPVALWAVNRYLAGSDGDND